MSDDDAQRQAKAKAATEAKVRLAFAPTEKAKTRSKIAPRDPASSNAFLRPYGAARGQTVNAIAVDERQIGLRRRRHGKRRLNLLRPVHPNVGLEVEYRRKLRALVDGMNADALRAIERAYEFMPPEMALDAIPAERFQAIMNEVAKRWQANFDAAAPMLAEYFATSAYFRTDSALRAALRKGGFSVRFQMTPAMNDIVHATVEANVGLIKSIPQQYLTQVQGMVMRSVQTGRDAGQLYSDIREQFGVTRRRAALIARDQNNKATSALHEARKKELGIDESVWMHSGGGKHPRPLHVKASGTVYKTGVGLPIGDKGQYVLPGDEINCRCVSRAVIPGF